MEQVVDKIDSPIDVDQSAERVIIFDTTLRDGEQSPGISLNPDEKVQIADQLGRLGVDVIEAGFPISSQMDFDATQAVAEIFKDRPTIICGLSRTAMKDVDRCWEAIEPAANRRIHVFIATSKIHMEKKLKMTPEQVIEETARAIAQAKKFTEDVEFSPEDASRSDFDFMCRVLQTAVDNGATTLNIPDTTGYTTPHEWAKRIAKIRQSVRGNYIISTHCHDDLGMATANSLSAVWAGARQVEGAINGIGERAGNAATEEVIMALDTRPEAYHHVFTNANLAEIMRTSRLVAELTGYPVPRNKAVVGGNAFAHEAGIHQHGVLEDRQTYEIMDANRIGSRSEIVIGKHSGGHAVGERLVAYGMPATITPETTRACKEAMAERGLKRNLTDVEVEEIAREVLGESKPDTVRIAGIEGAIHDRLHVVYIKLANGNIGVYEGIGEGQIEAVFDAFDKHFPGYTMQNWSAEEAPGQHGAKAEAYVSYEVIAPDGEIFTTCATDSDTVQATAKAFMRVVNLNIRRSKRMYDK